MRIVDGGERAKKGRNQMIYQEQNERSLAVKLHVSMNGHGSRIPSRHVSGDCGTVVEAQIKPSDNVQSNTHLQHRDCMISGGAVKLKNMKKLMAGVEPTIF
ncbi:uncharacterized protein ZBAI_01776 [Zygosaccharomyces bailii ISA1307]|nr:uncharacterized protein ZBAI_01776 [Zygosaccharomyces bailii ISA1307]